MRQAIFAFLVAVLIVPHTVGAETSASMNTTMAVQPTKLFVVPPQKGETSDAVKNLQEILKTDPSIYPQGLVSGYFGALTEEALKRLQARYGLPQTGILDEATQQMIFPPMIDLALVSPNGGEQWNKNAMQTISWKTTTGPVIMNGREALPPVSANVGSAMPQVVMPFFRKASIDLVRDSNPAFVYHVATVDLYSSQYAWTIPPRVPDGADYRVRISVGSHVPCLYRLEANAVDVNSTTVPCPMMPSYYATMDASDMPFSIAGDTLPSDETVVQLKRLMTMMEATLTELMRELKEMNALVGSL